MRMAYSAFIAVSVLSWNKVWRCLETAVVLGARSVPQVNSTIMRPNRFVTLGLSFDCDLFCVCVWTCLGVTDNNLS